MPIKDTFKYDARWDSVGLGCYTCQHFRGPTEWPDTGQVSACAHHRVSLAIELRPDGYMGWECSAEISRIQANPILRPSLI
jgi:hypothetical protein